MKINKYAAIDIGSNAIRLLIVTVIEDDNPVFIKDTYIRLPVRLGSDAFLNGEISADNAQNLIDAIHSFKLALKVNNVTTYKAFATSAMRSANNGEDILEQIKNELGVNIKIISGQKEADMIKVSGVKIPEGIRNSQRIFVDVGGGSTEISIESPKDIISKSFNIGTIRLLNDSVSQETWDDMRAWVEKYKTDKSKPIIIGSGGNINKVLKILQVPRHMPVHYDRIWGFYQSIKNMSLVERMKAHRLKLDRADVIEPATRIFINIMTWSNAENIYIPKIGLSDGIIREIYAEVHNKAKYDNL
jgi:exopolyphosphatase/guanosine-5'-triphosphate,3'-diphosphate pyrophosphatase